MTLRVLLSGMTAVQVNPMQHMRSPNFPGLLHEALAIAGHSVDWVEPSVRWSMMDLKKYDLVIVGVAPITSLGANRSYGALSVIQKLWNSKKLRLMVDAPDPYQMQSGLQSIVDHPENLTKDFFSNRKEFPLVKIDYQLEKRLVAAVELLNSEPWPTTIVPELPWHPMCQGQITRQLPLAAEVLLSLNLDALLFKRFSQHDQMIRTNEWSYEKGSAPNWVTRTNTTWPVTQLPKTHRRDTTEETMQRLGMSRGCLISPSKSGTWWSPRYAMSLAAGTPIFTDWHDTRHLGWAWSQLPSTFELMTEVGHAAVWDEQRASYCSTVPSYDQLRSIQWTTG